MPDLPSSLALTSIPADSAILSVTHRNNYSAIQTAANALILAMSGGTVGQVLTAVDSDTVVMADATGGVVAAHKSTAKVVNTTTTATDLLNAEFTIGANALGSTKVARVSAHGDWKQNSGGTADVPRFQFYLGPTLIIDTGAPGAVMVNAALRYGWSILITIAATGATNSQWVTFDMSLTGSCTTQAFALFTGGQGVYSISPSGNAVVAKAVAVSAAALNDTVDLTVVLNVVNASANANYEVALKDAQMEIF